jgi:eukaryotic-like serine/threonine-protein kinase
MAKGINQLYKFGPFQVEPAERLLLRDGQPVPVTPKAFDTLLVLIENSGHLVLKEDLMKAVWPDSFVEEVNLSQNISQLRRALGDSPQGSRYIATVPGRGYRFAEKVHLVTEEEPETIRATRSQPEHPGATTGTLALTQGSKLHRRPWNWVLLAAVVVVLGGIGAVVLHRMHRPTTLAEGDLILVSDFVNTTGEPIFDGSLKQALTVMLGESPYFNVALDSVTRQTLRLMGRSPDERVVPPIDREVCQREGAKVLVGGSIVAIGNKYVLDVNARNCLSGDAIAKQELQTQNKDEILAKIGQIVPPMRRKLGESLASIQKFDTPIEQATTPSLAALKAYTEGDQKRARGEEAESIPFYKMAIELDSNFAIAHARLGAIYGDLGERALADQYMKLAFERREYVSGREKFYISAHYFADATGETDKTIATYQLWTQTYSHDWIPFNNLCTEYYRIGQPDEAIAAGREALRLNPKHPLPYGCLVNSYRQGGHYAEAKAVSEKAIAAKLDNFVIHWNLYFIANDEQDEASTRQQIEWFKGSPIEHEFLNFQAWTAMRAGQVHKARELFDRARAMAIEHGAKENAATNDTDQAQLEAEFGNNREARAKAERAVQLMPESPLGQGAVAFTLARVGESARAEVMAKALSDKYPLNTQLNTVILPSLRAAIDLNHSSATVIEDLRPAMPYDFSPTSAVPDGIPAYYRGLAYLQQHSGKEAAAQFQSMIDHRGVLAFSPLWPLAHLGLARAYALTGQTEKSSAEYREFFTLWKDADTDIPILKEAKAEYAKLH